MITYKYIDRAKCECGYLWTTVGTNPPQTISNSVICICKAIEFKDGVLIGESLPIDEQEFKEAVAQDINIPISDLEIVKHEE